MTLTSSTGGRSRSLILTAMIFAIGNHLVRHSQLSWFSRPVGEWESDRGWEAALSGTPEVVGSLDPVAFLGAAAVVAILVEQREPTWPGTDPDQSKLGPLRDLLPYLARRALTDPRPRLPQLPVSEPFSQIFRDWADRKVRLTQQTTKRQPACHNPGRSFRLQIITDSTERDTGACWTNTPALATHTVLSVLDAVRGMSVRFGPDDRLPDWQFAVAGSSFRSAPRRPGSQSVLAHLDRTGLGPAWAGSPSAFWSRPPAR
jgi:hypothetical protein